MHDFQHESLSHDPIHGYIPFVARTGDLRGETTEQELIDHPWLQRLRYIHQLQTAWWVFPAAEHTRFQHVLGALHLASRAVARLYDSLREVCPDVPSRACVESLMRLAALLHDVGHGPFGHFLDDHFLKDFGLTHETLGCEIIRRELGPLISRIRRCPSGQLAPGESIDPEQIAFLIARPSSPPVIRGGQGGFPTASPGPQASIVGEFPRWLTFLRSLFCGIYTVDNMDFVLRDAYMSGYSTDAFDLDRILHYSFFSQHGLTVHARGMSALVKFMTVRAELFRAIYFHRTVRAIDLALEELFADSKRLFFPGNPLEHLAEYCEFTEASLLVDVARWARGSDPARQEVGRRWQALLNRQVPWKMAAERTRFFEPRDAEQATIFSHPEFFEQALREQLPLELRNMTLRVDLARHVHRPGTRGPLAGQNFVYEPSRDEIRPLSDDDLVRQIPTSYRICRVYAQSHQHDAALAAALDGLLGGRNEDTLTNM